MFQTSQVQSRQQLLGGGVKKRVPSPPYSPFLLLRDAFLPMMYYSMVSYSFQVHTHSASFSSMYLMYSSHMAFQSKEGPTRHPPIGLTTNIIFFCLLFYSLKASPSFTIDKRFSNLLELLDSKIDSNLSIFYQCSMKSLLDPKTTTY